MREIEFTLPAALYEALEKILCLIDDQEARPVVVVRHEGGWFPWELLPIHKPNGDATLLGLEFPMTRESLSEVQSNRRSFGDYYHNRIPSDDLMRVFFITHDARWTGNLSQDIQNVRNKLDEIADLKEEPNTTLKTIMSFPICFCWYVIITHLAKEGLETGRYTHITPKDFEDIEAREIFQERFVILAACEAGIPSPAETEGRIISTPRGLRLLFPTQEDSPAIADLFFNAGASSVVAPISMIPPGPACSYVLNLIFRIHGYGETSPVAVYRLKLQGGSISENPAFAFICYGFYNQGDICSRPGGCRGIPDITEVGKGT